LLLRAFSLHRCLHELQCIEVLPMERTLCTSRRHCWGRSLYCPSLFVPCCQQLQPLPTALTSMRQRLTALTCYKPMPTFDAADC
jgi:hypothetical protein